MDKSEKRVLPVYNYLKHPLFPDGYRMFSGIDQDTFDSALKYEPDDGDIYIVTYPKCGTTWMLNVLYLIEHGGEPISNNDNLNLHYPFLELVGADKVKEMKPPRVIKTHLDYQMIQQKDTAKYVFVARNPKDCVVSFFHHTLDFHNFYKFNGGQFDDYFDLFMDGSVDWGDYFAMVGRWFEKSLTQKNIHFMLYEDMKTDFKTEIVKLANFLGSPWCDLIKLEGVLEKVVHHSSFNTMKSNPLKYCITIAPKDLKFMRKGAIGDWRNTLSGAQSKRIDEKLVKTAAEFPGFDKIWAKYPNLM